jgi:hypothetical protein
MRLPPPKVPPAATAGFGAAMGPRLLPGTYTVRLTKDTDSYTAPLAVQPDPRVKRSSDDRRAQYELALKLYRQLEDMTFAVDRINGVRLGLDDRAGRLAADDPLAKRLRAASAHADDFRKKIVATKEGGMITGEERLREYLTQLYGEVAMYEGRPSKTQSDRTDALAREVADIEHEFDSWVASTLSEVNAAIAAKKLPRVQPIAREEWQKNDRPQLRR